MELLIAYFLSIAYASKIKLPEGRIVDIEDSIDMSAIYFLLMIIGFAISSSNSA